MSTGNGSIRNKRNSVANQARANQSVSAQLGTQTRKVAEDLQELGCIAKEAAQEKVTQLRDDASDYYEEGQETVRYVERTFEQYIQEKPIKSILIAAGVGLLLGRFWIRR